MLCLWESDSVHASGVPLQVTLEWDQVESHKDVPVTGYMVLVDDQQLGEALSTGTRKTTIDNLQPGELVDIELKIIQ